MTKRLTIKQKLHRQKLRKQVKLLKLGRRVRKTDGALYHAYQNYTIDSHRTHTEDAWGRDGEEDILFGG